MAVLLGGRAAEELIFQEVSTGAADDLGKATDIARSMATHYAMVPALGHGTYENEPGSYLGQVAPGIETRMYSEETAREIDCAVREILDKAFVAARGVLAVNRDLLEEGARVLLEKETLDEHDLKALFARLHRAS